jgi:hypothetical protein
VFRTTEAGALYAIIVFLIGFVCGTIRVLLLVPRLGETTAVTVEAPIMLAASWFVCRWCVDRLSARRTVPAQSLMGLVAFLVLMSAEVGLGALFGPITPGSACRLQIASRSDWSRSAGDLCYLPGHSGLAAIEPRSRCSSDSHALVPACHVRKKTMSGLST